MGTGAVDEIRGIVDVAKGNSLEGIWCLVHANARRCVALSLRVKQLRSGPQKLPRL